MFCNFKTFLNQLLLLVVHAVQKFGACTILSIFKEVYYFHQSCIYLIKTAILKYYYSLI